MQKFCLDEVIEAENEYLIKRRHLLGISQVDKIEFSKTKIGIALSGGGIRSATLSAGFLKAFNKCGILGKVDYLSTVSGGGYIGAYLQSALYTEKSYDNLFLKEHINHLKTFSSRYLAPKGARDFIILLWDYIFSIVFILINPLILFCIIYSFLYTFDISILFARENFITDFHSINAKFQVLLIFAVLAYFLLNLRSGNEIIIIDEEGCLYSTFKLFFGFSFLGYVLAAILYPIIININIKYNFSIFAIGQFICILLIFYLLGIAAHFDKNSFSNFFREKICKAFINNIDVFRSIKLYKLADPKNIAPYSIINACVSFKSSRSKDPNFRGRKKSDYFLLSPLFCGSNLTGYVETKNSAYKDLSFLTAITVSAAALNTSLGIFSNRLLELPLTVLNLRLGRWLPNPNNKNKLSPFWPAYFWRELTTGNKSTTQSMINVSDGGHIENLGVFELLRRRCRLIFCLDAGEDPNYLFEDLKNLIQRSRNELNIEIRFRHKNNPEEIIRPSMESVYSKQRFAIADLYEYKYDNNLFKPQRVKIGILVYVKSSLKQPILFKLKQDFDFDKFPHDSTFLKQFFSEEEWMKYFTLGESLGLESLGLLKKIKNSEISHEMIIQNYENRKDP